MTIKLDNTTQQALEQLITVAHADTGQSGAVANFLLAWHNASENGGFDLTDLWGLDEHLVSACAVVFLWVASHRAYPDELGYGEQFQALWQQWRGRDA